MVIVATVASIVATAGLGLIAFVPLVGLAVLPLQFAAWLVRGIVFEYVALAALGAYLSHYRWYQRAAEPAGTAARRDRPTLCMNTYERFFSSAAAQMKESAIRRMGTMIAARGEVISFAPGYPAPDTFAWDEFREIVDGLLNSRTRVYLQYGPTRGFRPLLEEIAAILDGPPDPT